jgi:hypothetical protein
MLVARGRLVIVSAVGMFCVSAAARADTAMRYQFTEGETLPYTLEQKMKTDMKIGGMDVTRDMTQTIDISWHVKSVNKDGKAKVVQRFDRLRLTMGSPRAKIEYDSKDGKQTGRVGKTLGPIMEALAGAEFSLTMDDRGQISDVKIPEKLSEALKKIPGGGLGEGELFSEEGIKHMIGEASLILPEGTATKGKTWTKEVTQKMPFGKIKTINISTYEGPTTRDGNQLEQIALKPKMTIEADDNADVSLKVKSQDAKGTAYFDNKAGRFVEMKMTQTMEMEVSAGGQTFSQKIEKTVTMKLNEKAK